jgi:hypothetical protein
VSHDGLVGIVTGVSVFPPPLPFTVIPRPVPKPIKTLRDFRFPPRSKRELRSSGLLHSV